ncbi:MAG: SspB family protein [Maricaulaceae bacterium]
MRYDWLAQEALRGVVREALRRAAREGLPGQHHFYISFRTRAAGVDIDQQLLEKYPDEMTIVLEHQFWDLAAEDDFFEVTLKFSGVPKYLKVPYSAVSRFQDPSVGFGLQFDVETGEGGGAPDDGGSDPDGPAGPDGDGRVVSLDAFRKR